MSRDGGLGWGWGWGGGRGAGEIAHRVTRFPLRHTERHGRGRQSAALKSSSGRTIRRERKKNPVAKTRQPTNKSNGATPKQNCQYQSMKREHQVRMGSQQHQQQQQQQQMMHIDEQGLDKREASPDRDIGSMARSKSATPHPQDGGEKKNGKRRTRPRTSGR